MSISQRILHIEMFASEIKMFSELLFDEKIKENPLHQ